MFGQLIGQMLSMLPLTVYDGEFMPLIYLSEVSQAGVAAPTDVVGINTTRMIPVWSYTGVGVYTLTFPNPLALAANKVSCFLQAAGTPAIFVTVNANSTVAIICRSYNAAGAATDALLTSAALCIIAAR